MDKKPRPISRFVQKLLPDASPEKLRDAQDAMDRFYAVLYRITERIEQDRQAAVRDKTSECANVEELKKNV